MHLTALTPPTKDIASLLELSGKAIQSLGKQTPTNGSSSAAARTDGHQQPQDLPPRSLTAEEQTQAFQDNMGKFLTTLHAVDVRLKRQIFGLEEAGILTLDGARLPKDKDAAGGGGGGGAQKPTLEPNGLGMMGSLDVGWLNSRSNQNERDMEAELWTKARKTLESVAGGAGANGGGGDVEMTG